MELQYKTLSFKANNAAENSGLEQNQFDGYGSTFNGPVDSYGHIIDPKAFEGTLDFFLEDGVILKEHRMSTAIGKPVEAKTDTTGLYLKGQISDTVDGRDCLTLLRDKVIKKLSIGFTTEGYEVLSKERGIEILGEQVYTEAVRSLPYWVDGITLLTQIKLYEVSLVAFPANTAASIMGVKSADMQRLAAKLTTIRQFEGFLRDAGYSANEAKSIASHGFKAMIDASGRGTNTEIETDKSAELTGALQGLVASIKGA